MKHREICEKCEIYKWVFDGVLFPDYSWGKKLGLIRPPGIQCENCEDYYCGFLLEHKIMEWANEV